MLIKLKIKWNKIKLMTFSQLFFFFFHPFFTPAPSLCFVFCFVYQIRSKFVKRLLQGCRCHLSPSFSLINNIINYELSFIVELYTSASSISFYWRRRHERRIFRRTYNIYEDSKLHILYGSHCRIQAGFRFKSHNSLECWNKDNVKRVYITSHQAVNIQAL